MVYLASQSKMSYKYPQFGTYKRKIQCMWWKISADSVCAFSHVCLNLMTKPNKPYGIIFRHEKRRRLADTVCGNFMRMQKFSTTCIEFYTYMWQIVDIYMTFYSEMLNKPSEH